MNEPAERVNLAPPTFRAVGSPFRPAGWPMPRVRPPNNSQGLALRRQAEAVLGEVLSAGAGVAEGDRTLQGRCWLGELTLRATDLCGMPNADALPAALAFELASRALLPHPAGVQADAPGNGSPLHTLQLYAAALPGFASPDACRLAQPALDTRAIAHGASLFDRCTRNPLPGLSTFGLHMAVDAGARLGHGIAHGLSSASALPGGQATLHVMTTYLHAASAQVCALRTVGALLQRKDITPPGPAAMWARACLEWEFRREAADRAARRMAATFGEPRMTEVDWQAGLSAAWAELAGAMPEPGRCDA